ncbi:winged helix DNA-binding domain-containing protein [Couchioplanes caeruleus]|uniref:winged helix DNA-binding domain-containing protein n=1 Tax=Couchioplanes caeruleus TaxID=56438 RepID=UPI0020BF46AB|nr:winged helix DNA-binding domain-containing protein [Couchioplanes caeruleus]UQU63376.1 winged helix DNA-binding domain-containing protein [Couchioplanes caeruleus]
MNLDEIMRRRIERHLLGGERGADVVEVARRIGGIHAQVASSAQAAADLRLGATADLEKALWSDRTLVRTWAARGTLHLLPAADLPSWVAAMSTRTRETTGSWLRYHGVTAAQMADIIAAVPDVLGGDPMTREELAGAVIAATGHEELRGPLIQGFGAILKPLAFRGLLCSGPPHGRNVTFVAPRAWFGDWEPVETEAAIDRLAAAYLDAYGPADSAEFARWFDLKPALARKAFARLDLEPVDGHGFLPAGAERPAGGESVLLLPAFDPYVVGSLRRLDVISSGPRSAVSRPQGWISPTLVVNGRIEGVWEERDGAPAVTAFRTLPAAVRRALPREAAII